MLDHKVRRKNKEITAFLVGDNVYRVIATSHGASQMENRGLNCYYIASACLALGLKLDDYNNTRSKIMLIDEGKNIAAVIIVEWHTIVIITVIDKADVFVSSNTIIERLGHNKAVEELIEEVV